MIDAERLLKLIDEVEKIAHALAGNPHNGVFVAKQLLAATAAAKAGR